MTDTSAEACAVVCMIVSNPGGEMQAPGWQKRVNDLIRALRDERNSLQTLVEAQTQSIRLTSDALLKENQRANAAEAERDKWKTACKAWEENSLEGNGEHTRQIAQMQREYRAMRENRDSLAAQLAKAVDALDGDGLLPLNWKEKWRSETARILSSLENGSYGAAQSSEPQKKESGA